MTRTLLYDKQMFNFLYTTGVSSGTLAQPVRVKVAEGRYRKHVGVTGMPGPEMRREPRALTQAFMVRALGECQRTYGYARDISSSGLQLRTFTLCESAPKKTGDIVQIEFRIPDSGLEVSCKAKVMWNVEPLHGPSTINLQGLTFVDIEPEVRERLDNWVKTSMAA